ncbi:Fasciclin-like arabinogalactan protein [Arachis hypogaea]|nr:Fasciclin-like arabinogalactan protein [Arachis hypogaea]
MKQPLFSTTLLILFTSFYSTTTLAQPIALSPSKSSDSSDSSSTDDMIKILRKAKSFNVLIRLLKTTQLINQINSQLIATNNGYGGLTIFAPDDASFSQLKPGLLNSLGDNQKMELLQFHLLPVYISSSNFDSLTNPVRTLAGESSERLQLNDKQLAIYHVDKVLLPLNFFKPKPPAPAPSPAIAPKTNNSTIDDENDLGTSKHSSGAIHLVISTQGTKLVSFGVALVVAFVTISK